MKLARLYIGRRLRLIAELHKVGMSEEAWCKTLGKGQSLSQMRRRIQLARPGCFQRYLNRRRALGDNGRFGLEYAIELSRDGATSTHPGTRVACASETPNADRPSQRETELEARVAELEIALQQKAAGPSKSQPSSAKRYWLTPPELYAALHAQYGFDFDPFPYPLGNFDGLAVPWRHMNFVNPPFSRENEVYGRRLSDIIRKAIAEQRLGNSSLILVPVTSVTNQLLAAGAIGTSLGRPRWREVSTGEPGPEPGCCAAFFLQGRSS